MPTRYQNYLQDFRAGVLSPRYSANVDAEAFAHSLKEGQNFIITSQGGAAYREGLEFVDYGATQAPFRLLTFRRGGDVSDLIIEVNSGITRYWIEDQSGTLNLLVDNITKLYDETSGPPEEVLTDEDTGEALTVGKVITSNPYQISELDTLYFTNQDKYGILCHENHPPTYITLNNNLTLTSEYLPIERIPDYVYNDYKSPQLVSQRGAWKITFPAGWEINGMIYGVTYNGVTGTKTFAFNRADPLVNVLNIDNQLTAAAVKQGLPTEFEVVAEDLLNYTVTVTGEGSGYDITLTPVQIYDGEPPALPPLVQADINEDTADPVAEQAWSYPLWTYIDTPTRFYYKCITPHKSTIDDRPDSGTNWELYWELVGAVKPEGYDYQNPDDIGWGANVIYSPQDRGFPTVTVFHEQRLFFMANRDNPTSLYGSAIGQFFAFTPGPNDDEPVLFILDSSDTPEIKWARSQKRLILGTSSGEWTIGSDVTITSTDIDAQMQNSTRAHLAMPVQIDTEIFYIEQGLRKLRSTRYNRDYGTFYSSYVSLMAEHLVSTDGIKRLAHSQTPETLLTMITTTGQPVWMTYEKDAKLLAFTQGVTDGNVLDVVSYFSLSENRDYTYYAVERNSKYLIERMRQPTNKTAEDFTVNDIVFMDSWVRGTVSGSTITGLEHIEGKEVYVLVDDAWQIGTFIVTNGQITLPEDESGKAYAVGLPYTGYLETFEIGDGVRGSTGLGTKRRWNRLITRILNSSLPLVYDERAADRRTEIPMGESDNVRAGLHDIQQSVSGYTKGALMITQDRPYPLYLVAFMGEYQVEDR